MAQQAEQASALPPACMDTSQLKAWTVPDGPVGMLMTESRNRYLKRAERVETGDTTARLDLAHDLIDCVAEHKPVPDDRRHLAMSWLETAANAGDRVSAMTLARIHAAGTGVPVDDDEAYRWYALAVPSAADEVTRHETHYDMDAQQAQRFTVWAELARSLLTPGRLYIYPRDLRGQAWPAFSLTLHFTGCDGQVVVQVADPVFDDRRVHYIQNQVATALARYPSAPSSCTNKRGEPIPWQLPIHVKAGLNAPPAVSMVSGKGGLTNAEVVIRSSRQNVTG
ncbi:hypothetical protein [Luteibacter sp.]|uniref:hypothetical protein n=1 Tax=Luteibacter sp. TaxID=1886636 RepID=UPI0025BA6265|nr:hypothetical protein [Luteibacter sp.]